MGLILSENVKSAENIVNMQYQVNPMNHFRGTNCFLCVKHTYRETYTKTSFLLAQLNANEFLEIKEWSTSKMEVDPLRSGQVI